MACTYMFHNVNISLPIPANSVPFFSSVCVADAVGGGGGGG